MFGALYPAFGLPSNGELLVILVIGLLIFGRRLPEVGRAVGKTLVQLRKGVQDFKTQLDADEDLREVKSTVRDIRKVTEAPRVLANPQQWMDNLTDEKQASPGPERTASPGATVLAEATETAVAGTTETAVAEATETAVAGTTETAVAGATETAIAGATESEVAKADEPGVVEAEADSGSPDPSQQPTTEG